MRRKKLRSVRFILFMLFLGITQYTFAQCECTDCPVFIPNNATVTSTLNISGASNNDLGSASQQVCQLCIHFDTDAIKELEFTITSPSGSSLTLFDQSGINVNDNYVFDICFVSCSETAMPDAGHADVFDTDDNWLENSTYTGSYYPFIGCLEDLTGDVNGDWVLTMEDDTGGDSANLLDWYLIFADDTGLDCTNAADCNLIVCDADAGVLNITNSPTCPTEEISFEVIGFYDDPAYGQYLVVADENGIIVDVIEGGLGSYTYDYCAVYTVYSYNFDLNDLPVPHVDDDVSTIDCSVGCCDVTEMTIEWADNMTPTFTYLPPHPNFPVTGGPFVELYCVEDIIPPEDAEYDDNCIGMGTVTPMDTDFTDPCDGGQYFRRWEIGDSCFMPLGVAFEYIVTVEPAPLAFFENPPDDYTADCDNIPTTAPVLNYTNNGISSCNILEGTGSATIEDNTSPCGGEVLITWSAVDECGRDVEHTQTVTVLPFPEPSFADMPDDITITCDEIPADIPTLLVTNNESGDCLIEEIITATVEDNTNGCNGTIVYTWTYASVCDLNLEYSQTLTLDPPPIASFVDAPPADIVPCDELPIIPTTLAYTNGEVGDCAIEGEEEAIIIGNVDGCGGSIQYLWEFEDDCGREISYTQNITLLASDPAVFIDVPEDITLVCGGTFEPDVLFYSNGVGGDCAVDGVEVPTTSQTGNVITATWSHIQCDGTEITATQMATLQDNPTISINPDIIEICEESSYDLADLNIDLMGGVNGVITYHLSSPPTNDNEIPSSIVTPTQSITYTVAVTYPDGCQAYDEVTIILEEPISSAESAIGIICDQSVTYNLFDILVNVVNTDGTWFDFDNTGVDISDPTSVDFSSLDVGEYVFQYTGISVNSCLPDVATATIRVGEQVFFDIQEIDCSADESTYSIELETNDNASIFSSQGMVNMINDTVYQITEVSIDSIVTITGLGANFICNEAIDISPPDCNCPDVVPPMGGMQDAICPHQAPVVLTATADPGLVINWYDSPIGGVPVATDVTEYTPLDSLPGTYTYFVESVDANGCVSEILNSVWFTILMPPEDDTLYLERCIDYVSDESIFSPGDILILLLDNISSPPPVAMRLFNTYEDAVSETDAIVGDIILTGVDPRTIFAHAKDDNQCFSIVPITLVPILYPTAILDVTEEICDGGSDGMVALTIDQDSVLSSLDGLDFDSEIVYDQLSAGTHTVSLIDSNMCINEDSFEVESGFVITVDNLNFECFPNDTAEDPNDDYWTMTFALSTDSGSPDYTLLVDGVGAGVFAFDQQFAFDLAADNMLHTILFVDNITGCGRPVSSPILEPCSIPCSVFPDASIVLDNGPILNCINGETMATSVNESNVVYTWTFDGLFFDPLQSITEEGELVLVALDTISGCMADSTIMITSIIDAPSIVIATPQELTCNDGSITIDASASDAGQDYNYLWSDQSGIIQDETNATLEVNAPGWYYFTITNGNNGCTNIDSVEVMEDGEMPTVDLADDVMGDCDAASIEISAVISNATNYSVGWSTTDGQIVSAANQEMIEVAAPGLYYVLVINEDNLCATLDSVEVDFVPVPTLDNLVINDVFCDSVFDGFFQFGDYGSTAPYVVNVNSEIVTTDEFYVFAGIVTVGVTDANGCTADSIFTINPAIDVDLDLDAEIEFLEGQENILEATINVDEDQIQSIKWSPSNNLSCDDCLSPVVIMGANETYTITVIDINGCESMASINVLFEEVLTPSSDIIIPNIFSPNGDGSNDYFVIQAPEGLALDYLEVYVFDRWGEQVYFGDDLQSADESAFWNGSYNGSNVNPGVYVYYARAIVSGTQEEKVFYGDISVVR